MVDQVGCMVAVYDNVNNMRSGTQQTVNYAKRKDSKSFISIRIRHR